jgi:hypothetical protein
MGVVNALWPIAMKVNFGVEKMTGFWVAIVLLGLMAAWVGAKFLEFLQGKELRLFNLSLSRPTLWLWVLTISLVMSIPIVLLGVFSFNGMMNIWMFMGGFLCFNFGYGFLMPGLLTLENNYIPVRHSQERATIESWISMVSEFFLLLLVFPSSGGSGQGTVVAWILPAGSMVIVVLIVNILLRRYQRKTGELPVDRCLISESL